MGVLDRLILRDDERTRGSSGRDNRMFVDSFRTWSFSEARSHTASASQLLASKASGEK
jgi:hypothetical protein